MVKYKVFIFYFYLFLKINTDAKLKILAHYIKYHCVGLKYKNAPKILRWF